MLFSSDYAFRRITEIPIGFFDKQNIRGVVLDIDNTLTTHDNPAPAAGVIEWLKKVKESGVKLIAVSNNNPFRVRPFAELLGIDFVADGAKPLTKGINEAMRRMKTCRRHTAAIGDQIFTDALGANIAGIRMIYVSPIEHEKTIFFKIKRFAEKPFIPKHFTEPEDISE